MAQALTVREQLERLFVLLRRATAFWKRGFLVLLIGIVGSVPYVFTRERAYRSETLILYHETISADANSENSGGPADAKHTGARLRELLLSRTSLEPIIKDLHLYPDRIIKGESIAAVEEMRRNITFRAGDGDTYQIAFVAKTPALAQEVTRRLADCIVHAATKGRSDQATTLKDFLDGESTRNETELKQHETELTTFLVLHPEFVPKRDGQPDKVVPVVPTGATAVDPLLGALESRAARVERQLNFDAGAPAPLPPRPVFKPPPDSAELVAARKDLADKQARFTDKHPDVTAARIRLKNAQDAQAVINQQAAAEFAAANKEEPPPPPQGLSPEAEAALRKELTNIQAQIWTRRAQLTANGSDAGTAKAVAPVATTNDPVALAVEFRRLSREVEDGRDQQQKLDQRLFRAQIAASSIADDRNTQVSILDPAFLPVQPVSKSRTNLLAALLGATFLLAFGVVIVSQLLDDRIYDRGDLERFDIMPIVGVIPTASNLKRLPPAPPSSGT